MLQLGSAIKLSTSDYEIKLLEERLLKLSRGAAILKVRRLGIANLLLQVFSCGFLTMWVIHAPIQYIYDELLLIKVGGASNKEMKTKNSLNAVKAALEEGIVPGKLLEFHLVHWSIPVGLRISHFFTLVMDYYHKCCKSTALQ